MLRANRDATRQKDPKGFVVQTSSNEICRQLWKRRTDNFEHDMKYNCCIIERPFKIQKNCTFLLGILFVLEILTF